MWKINTTLGSTLLAIDEMTNLEKVLGLRLIEVVSHQIKTDKMQYMKVNQVVSQRPIFSFKASISRWTQQ